MGLVGCSIAFCCLKHVALGQKLGEVPPQEEKKHADGAAQERKSPLQEEKKRAGGAAQRRGAPLQEEKKHAGGAVQERKAPLQEEKQQNSGAQHKMCAPLSLHFLYCSPVLSISHVCGRILQ